MIESSDPWTWYLSIYLGLYFSQQCSLVFCSLVWQTFVKFISGFKLLNFIVSDFLISNFVVVATLYAAIWLNSLLSPNIFLYVL